MHWTWTNLLVAVIGLVVIIGSSFLIRHREAVFKLIVDQNSAMYGKRLGGRMERSGSTWGVLIPAVFGVVIGIGFVLIGIFGHPGS
jgi:hypothetical protein